MRLESFRACIHLVQHERVGFLLWHKDLELQGAGLGCQAALGMSLKMLQVFIPLARHRLDRCHDCKFAHMSAPLRGSDRLRRRLFPIVRLKCSEDQCIQNIYFWRDQTPRLLGF